jgi:hypothetical protein
LLTALSNSRWINYIEFGKRKTMLSSSMGLVVCKLNLQGHILKSNNLVLDGRPNIEAINSNVFGELMLHRVLHNTDSTSTVKVHMRRGGESNTKIS